MGKSLFLAALIAMLSTVSAAAPAAWGFLPKLTERQWTTEGEPQERTSIYRWRVPGRELIGLHGPTARLGLGDEFADIEQHMALDGASGAVHVTYRYKDGRPPLRATITFEADGSAVERFSGADGIPRRNIYRSAGERVSLIERQVADGETWTTTAVTRRGGLTPEEVSEKARAEYAARAERDRMWDKIQEDERLQRERSRLASQQADAEAQRILQEGFSRAARMATLPPGTTPEQADFEAEVARRAAANIAARRSAGSSGGGGTGAAITMIDDAEYREFLAKTERERQAAMARDEAMRAAQAASRAASEAAAAQDAARQSVSPCNAPPGVSCVSPQ